MEKVTVYRIILLLITASTLLFGRVPTWIVSIPPLLLLLYNVIILPVFSLKISGKDGIIPRPTQLDGFFYGISTLLLFPLFYTKPILIAIVWGITGFGNIYEIFNSDQEIYSSFSIQKNLKRIILDSLMGGVLSIIVLYFLPRNLYLDQSFRFWVIVIFISSFLANLFKVIPGLIHQYLVSAFSAALISWGIFEASLNGHFFFPLNIWSGCAVVGLFVVLSYLSGKIDLIGAITGGFIALGLFLGGNWGSLGLLFIFFVVGSFVSSWKKSEKKSLKLDQENEGKRSINNALSNGGVAGFLGFLAWIFPNDQEILLPMIAASIAAAISDTFSSELGNVYGKKYVNILNFKVGRRGQDGVISLKGSLFGVLGSAIIAAIYGFWNQDLPSAMIVFFAGYAGNLMDSFLGATLQKKGFMNNDTVNFGCTLFAALFAGWLIGIIL